MKIAEIAKLLPRLGSYDRDIESWAEEFNRVMELSDIDDPRKMFAWAKECVPGRLKGVIENLKEEDEEAEMIIYPSITDIKTAIEEFLDITPQEKCFNLKSLKIQKGESIKDFNWRYSKYYGSLTPEGQAFITINDYTDSLLSRPYARKEVITSQPGNLEEAFRIAELAETASEVPNRNRNVVMFTNTYGDINSIFPNNYNNNYNNNYSNNYNNNYNNPNNYDYNNYHTNYNNNNNGYNHSNNYNNNHRISYNNNFNNPNNNRNPNHIRNSYNSNNNYNHNNLNFNNMNNNFGNNKIYSTKNNFRNQNFMSNNINLNCFKCHQPGHRMQDCPYTYQELADMEATGRLNNNNRYITNNINTNENHNLNNNNNYNNNYNINNLSGNSNINTNNVNHYNSNRNFNVNTNYNNTGYNNPNFNNNNINPINNNNQNYSNNNIQPLNY